MGHRYRERQLNDMRGDNFVVINWSCSRLFCKMSLSRNMVMLK